MGIRKTEIFPEAADEDWSATRGARRSIPVIRIISPDHVGRVLRFNPGKLF